MTIHFDIPASIQQAIGRGGDPAAQLKEAGLVELYRMGQISHGQLAEGLGISRSETDAVLQRHQVTEDLLRPDELDAQLERLRSMVG